MPLLVPLLRHRGPRGQALVLAALSMLILALMLMLSFNVSQALHEKIRLQQHSDALVYSMAIVEARSFNFFAAGNRAEAAAFSAMNSLHAYLASATVTADMMTAGKKNLQMIAVLEFAYCATCCWPYCFSNCKHCLHGLKAMNVARKYSSAASDYGDKVQDLESMFNMAIQMLELMVNLIHLSQTQVLEETVQAIQDGSSSNLGQLKQTNAPRSQPLNSAVGAMNATEYLCAIDGYPCQKEGGTSDPDTHSKLMTEIANATRTQWAANRSGYSFPMHLNPQFLNDLMSDIPDPGMSFPLPTHKGTAKTIESTSQSDLESGPGGDNTGKVSGADEHGQLFSQYECFVWLSSYKAEVYSDENGGKHDPGLAHDDDHDKFTGVNSKAITSCIMSGDCFMKFRANKDPDADFNQPHVYSYVTQTLRESIDKAPWQVTDSAQINFDHGEQGTGTVTLAPGDGAGVSKAMVYYHRLGDWTEPPNFFNAFWRAKLHPFTPTEAAEVLGAAGNSDAAQLANLPDFPL